MPTTDRASNLARRRGFVVRSSRRLGVAAVVVVTGLSVVGAPVRAQLPELPPLTLAPTDPATTDPATTTTTLLPPIDAEKLLPPAPASTTPPPSLLPLPLPTTAAPRRTTTYKPPPVPPSTPVRATRTAAKAKAAPAATGIPADRPEGASGEADNGFGAELPFANDQAAVGSLSAADTMELGVEGRDQVGSLASAAAGLLVLVLFGIAMWVRREIREPAPLPPW
ncbi:MAG TPA: hypothetical protein VHM89_02520 [Acidimicrobiales bacterium]|nr:hypothetical protein [Acidimicrobiales bacterium]